jgi:hypothetical protein
MSNDSVVVPSNDEDKPVFAKLVNKDGDVNRIKELLFDLAKYEKDKSTLPSGKMWKLTITPQSEDK